MVVAVAATTYISVAGTTPHYMDDRRKPTPAYWQAAGALNEKGIRRGDKVALIASEPWGEGGSFVARLARIQIIAQVNRPESFWAASPSTQCQLIKSFAKTGAKAILASGEPRLFASETGWQRLENSSYYVLLLDNETR